MFIAETQKTRTGTDGDDNQTRPYRYGEFDVLAVSMQPSTGKWDRFMFTLGRWLLPGKKSGEMATLQPVTNSSSEFWTEDFTVVANWFRTEDHGKRMSDRVTTKTSAAVERNNRKPASTKQGPI